MTKAGKRRLSEDKATTPEIIVHVNAILKNVDSAKSAKWICETIKTDYGKQVSPNSLALLIKNYLPYVTKFYKNGVGYYLVDSEKLEAVNNHKYPSQLPALKRDKYRGPKIKLGFEQKVFF